MDYLQRKTDKTILKLNKLFAKGVKERYFIKRLLMIAVGQIEKSIIYFKDMENEFKQGEKNKITYRNKFYKGKIKISSYFDSDVYDWQDNFQTKNEFKMTIKIRNVIRQSVCDLYKKGYDINLFSLDMYEYLLTEIKKYKKTKLLEIEY